eukprot:CAMPEP_0168315314 /NCGR_PEP_ID=MMETSP0210-20121227/10801_1 /TAXON_ID=40633 /ORGANISM="Condylostoma magnum, Strain COL2" /LENGTH=36 /DNA_ID= /DNA_START= /DNA_END= /DNA_ORIENTATION=
MDDGRKEKDYDEYDDDFEEETNRKKRGDGVYEEEEG